MMKHRGIKWTEDEVSQLINMYSSGIIVSEISSKLERSESAIQKKIKEVGVLDRKNIWAEDEKEEVIHLFKNSMSNDEIAKKMGRSVRSIQAELVRLGYKRKEINVWKTNKREDFWSDDECQNLKELVENGMAAQKISEKLGRSQKAVFYQMKKMGLSIMDKTDEEESKYRRAYTLNDDYFEIIDSQIKAYLLGWMITDGYVSSTVNSGRNGLVNSSRIGLKVVETDREILELFRNEIQCEIPIKYHRARSTIHNGKEIKSKTQCSLTFSSVKMIKDLSKYGVVPKKTYNVIFPNALPIKYYPGFIAGVISGDGSIDVKKNHKTGFLIRCSIAGTKNLLEGIKSILEKNIGFNHEKIIRYVKSTKCLYLLELSQTETIALYHWLDRHDVKLLSRKDKIITDYVMSLEK